MEQILPLLFLLFGIIPLSNAASTCYFPDGVSSTDYTPCVADNSSFSACCAVGDECLTNGLCKATGMRSSTAFWRDLCTDPSWQSDACPKYCYNETTSHEASAQTSFVLACSNTTYCCAKQSLALSSGNYSYCCGDESALFTAAPLVHLSGPHNPLPLFTSIASTSVSVSTSSPSSTTTGTPGGTESNSAASTNGSALQPANNNGSSLSTGAKAGIGVGVAAAVFIIAAALFTVRRSRAKGNIKGLTRFSAGHSPENGRGYGSPSREQKTAELSGDWAVSEKESKSEIPELSNDGAKFELGGVRRPVELEGAER